RMHVVLSTDRARIAEPLRDLVDRGDDVRLCLLLGLESAELAKCSGRKRGARPGAEVLRRHLSATDSAEILIDITSVDRLPTSIGVEILKELLTGKLLASLDDVSNTAVGHSDRVRH